MNPFVLIRSRSPLVLVNMVIEKILRLRLSNFNELSVLFKDKSGIEVGGPSLFFSKNGYMPVYGLAQNIDGCNYSNNTMWASEIKEGKTYKYAANKIGYQFICEGSDVAIIPKSHYDFVLSCNSLEHIANPLKAINNWLKLLKDKGVIVLVLPRKETNFDHNRPVTEFKHLLDDYNKSIGEDDLTHLPEILKLHDLKLDPLAAGFDNFKKRSEDNFNNRCLHHHVFDLELLSVICNFFKLKILAIESKAIDHIIVAQK